MEHLPIYTSHLANKLQDYVGRLCPFDMTHIIVLVVGDVLQINWWNPCETTKAFYSVAVLQFRLASV